MESRIATIGSLGGGGEGEGLAVRGGVLAGALVGAALRVAGRAEVVRVDGAGVLVGPWWWSARR